jgi:Carbohydrate-selective porin, OprB family
LFGRYGYGSYSDTAFGNLNPNYWMAGISFRDLFIKQALAGIAAGQPFIEGTVGNATQTNFEAFYNYQVNDNVRLTPLIQVVTNKRKSRKQRHDCKRLGKNSFLILVLELLWILNIKEMFEICH